MNIVILNGNLTRDVEVRSTASGTTVMNFGLAVPDRKRNASGEYEDYAHFVDCILFDPKGVRQWMVPMLKKGFHVTVHGKLNYTSWENKEGQKRSKLEVIVNEVDGRWPPKQQQGYAPQQAPQQQYQPAPQQQQFYPNQAPIGYQPQGYAQAPVAPQQAPQANYAPMPQYAPQQQPPQAPTAPPMMPQQPQMVEDVYDEDIPF